MTRHPRSLPTPPPGTRWQADPPDASGWMVLRLGPVNWLDEQMRPASALVTESWPCVFATVTAAATDDVLEAALSLVGRFRYRFPHRFPPMTMADAINRNLPLPEVSAVQAQRQVQKRHVPVFERGEWVRIGPKGAPRRVVETLPDGRVVAETMDGIRRRANWRQLVRISEDDARKIAESVPPTGG